MCSDFSKWEVIKVHAAVFPTGKEESCVYAGASVFVCSDDGIKPQICRPFGSLESPQGRVQVSRGTAGTGGLLLCVFRQLCAVWSHALLVVAQCCFIQLCNKLGTWWSRTVGVALALYKQMVKGVGSGDWQSWREEEIVVSRVEISRGCWRRKESGRCLMNHSRESPRRVTPFAGLSPADRREVLFLKILHPGFCSFSEQFLFSRH